MKKLLLFLTGFLPVAAFGQASIFQDAKGESALKLFGSAVAVNAKTETISATIDVLKRDSNSNGFKRWALNLELGANEGIANVKSEKGFVVDGSVGIYRGWKRSASARGTGPGWTYERFVSVNGGIDQNKFFNINRAKKDMLFNKSEFAWKVELGQFGYRGNLLYGVSASLKRQSNIGDLKAKTLRLLDYQLHNDSTSIYTEKKAFDELEFNSGRNLLSLNADMAWLVNRAASTPLGSKVPSMFVALQLRFQKIKNDVGQFSPALGFYLGKPDSPRNVVGGFNIQFVDLFNGQDSETTAWKRAAINVVVGFKLGN